ncbi:MAG: phosphoribosylformylglycinamidine synthase subunit PurS [Microscillaceae bacterium]
MKVFVAEIEVMPRKEILDPQGKAIALGLANLGLEGVQEVRMGKHIQLQLQANDEAEARQKTEAACRQLLVNAIMEDFTFQLHHQES